MIVHTAPDTLAYDIANRPFHRVLDERRSEACGNLLEYMDAKGDTMTATWRAICEELLGIADDMVKSRN